VRRARLAEQRSHGLGVRRFALPRCRGDEAQSRFELEERLGRSCVRGDALSELDERMRSRVSGECGESAAKRVRFGEQHRRRARGRSLSREQEGHRRCSGSTRERADGDEWATELVERERGRDRAVAPRRARKPDARRYGCGSHALTPTRFGRVRGG
jgi:hypothetical protein